MAGCGSFNELFARLEQDPEYIKESLKVAHEINAAVMAKHDRLIERLRSITQDYREYYEQHRCGCGHPSCRRCSRDDKCAMEEINKAQQIIDEASDWMVGRKVISTKNKEIKNVL